MEVVNPMIASWGPALLICFTVVIGIIYNSSRVSDLKSYMDARFGAADKRFDEVDKRFERMERHFDARLDSLKDLLSSEIRRVEDRLSPIHRP